MKKSYPIQFGGFHEALWYETENQCVEALFQARWRFGFQCYDCGRRYRVIKVRDLYQCTACHR